MMAMTSVGRRMSVAAMACAVIGFGCCIGWVAASSVWWMATAACAWIAAVYLSVGIARRGRRVPALVWCWGIVGAVLAFATLVGLAMAMP